MYYTLGQRKGIGIGGKQNTSDDPWFVLDKDLKRNVLVIGQGKNHPMLYKKKLIASQLTWVSGDMPDPARSYHAKIRYRQTEQPCRLDILSTENISVQFDEPQRSITPGQSVVIYDNDRCLGGGVIINAT